MRNVEKYISLMIFDFKQWTTGKRIEKCNKKIADRSDNSNCLLRKLI